MLYEPEAQEALLECLARLEGNRERGKSLLLLIGYAFESRLS